MGFWIWDLGLGSCVLGRGGFGGPAELVRVGRRFGGAGRGRAGGCDAGGAPTRGRVGGTGADAQQRGGGAARGFLAGGVEGADQGTDGGGLGGGEDVLGAAGLGGAETLDLALRFGLLDPRVELVELDRVPGEDLEDRQRGVEVVKKKAGGVGDARG